MIKHPFATAALLLTLMIGLVLFFVFRSGDLPSAPQSETMTPAITVATTLLHQPLPLHRVEHSAAALAVWRTCAGKRPTLLLLASNPLLLRSPPSLQTDIDALAARGSMAQLALRGTPQAAYPLLLPDMTLDVALRLGWFSEVVWVLPMSDPGKTPELDVLRQQLLDAGVASADEIDSLTLDDEVIRGRLRDVPFTMASLPNLPDTSGPLVLHIDSGYFEQMYKNEIATSLFSVLFEVLNTLRDRSLPALAATFNYGNLEGRIALDVRFIGEVLAQMIELPATFDQPTPENWDRQTEALYLANFFNKERIAELNVAMEQAAPESAWVKFNLYRSAAEHKEGDRALDYLSKAVALDRLYALEYLDLANLAYDRERPDEALRMLSLANTALPELSQVRLQMAQLSQEMGDRVTALHLVEQLRTLSWSPVYYPEMPGYLARFADFLAGKDSADGPAKEWSKEEGSESDTTDDSQRQRVLNPVEE